MLIRLSSENVASRLIDEEPNFDNYERTLNILHELDNKGDYSAMRYIDIYANNRLANAETGSEVEDIHRAMEEYVRIHDEFHDTSTGV